MRYMPTFRSPLSGSLVTTQGRVMKRPASSGQHLRMGMESSVGHGPAAPHANWCCWWTISWHGPLATSLGFACRKSRAVPSSLIASAKLVGGLALSSEASSAATSSTDCAPKLRAMRRWEPKVLMASGKGDTWPLTVGRSISRAFPPPGDFISRSANSVISNSVATGWRMRLSSPSFSSACTNWLKES